jgi:hypothetical protein
MRMRRGEKITIRIIGKKEGGKGGAEEGRKEAVTKRARPEVLLYSVCIIEYQPLLHHLHDIIAFYILRVFVCFLI